MPNRLLLNGAIIFASCAASISNSALARSDAAASVQSLRAEAISCMSDPRSADMNNVQESYERAVHCYQKAIEMASGQYGSTSSYVATLNFELGNIYYKGGNFEKAGQQFAKAVEIAPNNQSMRLRLAKYYRQHGEEKTHLVLATTELNKIIKANPHCLEAKKEYALCYKDAHQPVNAAKAAATLTKGRNAKNQMLATADPSLFQQALSFGQAVGVSAMGALHQNSPVVQQREEEAQAKKAKEALAAAEKAERAERARREQEAQRRRADQEQQEKRAREKAQEEENRKQKSKPKKEKEQPKEQPKSKPAPAASKPAAKQPAAQPAEQTSTEQAATLKTTAKITKDSEKGKEKEAKDEAKTEAKPAKHHSLPNTSAVGAEKPVAEEKQHDSGVSENEPAKPKEPKNKPVEQAPMQMQMPTMPMMPVVAPPPDMGKKPKKPKGGGFVPPPPPTPVVSPFMPPQMMPPPQMQPQQAKPKPKPKPAPKETPKDTDDVATPTKASSPAASDDPDFLIDWGASGKKKHK